ncbi:hypothetical protein BBJ28_00000793 [Nothophytophthora sp. Chile5]|nr:hypothetical protein BBJ28_00000793 [Nothophytophthora sp. Chile5]
MRVMVAQASRFSESAIPEHFDPEFQLPTEVLGGNRSSLAAYEQSAAKQHYGFGEYGIRDSCTSEASGFDLLQFWTLDEDHEASASQCVTPSSMMRQDPYQGICVEVNSHSINNQGVVMYHVDIKGPEGLLSTYTIRRRFRAFKHLHAELNRLMSEYAASRAAAEAAVAAVTSSSTPLSTTGVNIPLSPHSEALEKQMHGPPLSVTARTLAFPALPSAGVWSYLKRHDVRLVEQRKKRFQEILRLAIRHPATKSSSVLDEFLSVAPSEISQRGSSYVSLQDYSVPVFDHQRESIERRQRKLRVLEDRRMRAGSDSQY